MELRSYIENVQRQLVVAGDAGGDDARAMAERLVAPLDAAIRLTLLEVLAAAAQEITTDLAPGSVQLQLQGREPQFVVTSVLPAEDYIGDYPQSGEETATGSQPRPQIVAPDGDDGAMSRINLRLPDHLKARIEQAAANEGLSVNAWLVRAAAVGLEQASTDRQRVSRPPQGAARFTGWAR